VTEKVLPFERQTLPGQSGSVTGAFVEAVADGRQPMTAGRDALEVTRVIDAAYRSAREQHAITLQ
jgi:predicted dehydrogenase